METSTLLFMAIGLATASLAALGWYLRRRSPREEPAEHCRCSCCGQKMRYHASKQGQVARCPRCGSKEILADRPRTSGQPILRVGQKLPTPVPSTRSA